MLLYLMNNYEQSLTKIKKQTPVKHIFFTTNMTDKCNLFNQVSRKLQHNISFHQWIVKTKQCILVIIIHLVTSSDILSIVYMVRDINLCSVFFLNSIGHNQQILKNYELKFNVYQIWCITSVIRPKKTTSVI